MTAVAQSASDALVVRGASAAQLARFVTALAAVAVADSVANAAVESAIADRALPAAARGAQCPRCRAVEHAAWCPVVQAGGVAFAVAAAQSVRSLKAASAGQVVWVSVAEVEPAAVADSAANDPVVSKIVAAQGLAAAAGRGSSPRCPVVDNAAALRFHAAGSGSSRIESHFVVLLREDIGPPNTAAGSRAIVRKVERCDGPIGPTRFDDLPSRGPSAHPSVVVRQDPCRESTLEVSDSSGSECAARTAAHHNVPPTATARCTSYSHTSYLPGTPSTGRRRRSNSISTEGHSRRDSPGPGRAPDTPAS